jgi:hypothetical protein
MLLWPAASRTSCHHTVTKHKAAGTRLLLLHVQEACSNKQAVMLLPENQMSCNMQLQFPEFCTICGFESFCMLPSQLPCTLVLSL